MLGANEGCGRCGRSLVVQVLDLDRERKALQAQLNALLAKRKQGAEAIRQGMQQGKLVATAKASMQTLKATIKGLAAALAKCEAGLLQALYLLPNLPHASVPVGVSSKDNKVIKTVAGLPRALPRGGLPHWELGKKYGIVNFELGNNA